MRDFFTYVDADVDVDVDMEVDVDVDVNVDVNVNVILPISSSSGGRCTAHFVYRASSEGDGDGVHREIHQLR